MTGLTTVVAVSILSALLLGGCTSSAQGESSDPDEQSLTQTKSAVQLIRNDAAARIPGVVIPSIESTEDVSQSCDGDDSVRRWHSSVVLSINTDTSMGTAGAVADRLIAGFVDEGWSLEATEDSDLLRDSHLTNRDISVDLHVTASAPASGGDAHSSLRIAVDGPCVHTAGPDSDEVRLLEGRS